MNNETYRIESFRKEKSLHGQDCYAVWVNCMDNSYLFTQVLGEEDMWYNDAHFGPNHYPYFSHGIGSRSCKKKVALDKLHDLLEAEKNKYESGISVV